MTIHFRLKSLLCLLALLVSGPGQAQLKVGTLKTGTMGQAPAAPVSLFSGITHVWHMEENNATRVDSVGTDNLVQPAGNIASGTGKHNNACSFTTGSFTDYLNTSGAHFTCGNILSISLWVKLRTLPAAGQTYTLTYGDDGADGVDIFTVNEFGTLTYEESSGGAQATPAVGVMTANVWHLIVGVRQSGQPVSLSVDGGAFASQDPGLMGANTYQWFVGLPTGGPVPDGLIDELYIWNRALSQSDVTALWNSGAGTFAP